MAAGTGAGQAPAADPLAALKARAKAALFPAAGTLDVPGLTAPVTVTRDARGVPSIEAASLEDLWFAQGLVTAGERLAQLDLSLRTANGRLAELLGERAFDGDRFARVVGLHLAGAAYVASWSEEDHAMHRRFREGVAAWIKLAPAPPVEYELLDTTPALPEEPEAWAAATAYLAWNLSGNMEQELLRAGIRARLGEDAMRVLVPPTAGRGGRGSNGWVVSGAHTASGLPLLANDPHLLALQPGPWLQMDLLAPGYRARGVALAFSPGVVLGASPHHAWGTTNVSGDVQDLFAVTDDDVIATREEPIGVLGEPSPRIVHVRETRHGPIVDRIPGRRHRIGLPGRARHLRAAVGRTGDRAPPLDRGSPGGRRRCRGVPRGRHGGHLPRAEHAVRRRRGPHRAPGDRPLPHPRSRRRHRAAGGPRVERVGARRGAARDLGPAGRDGSSRPTTTRPTRVGRATCWAATSTRGTAPFASTSSSTRRRSTTWRSFAAIQRDTVSLAARETTPLLLERVPSAKTWLDGWDHDLRADSTAAAVWTVWTETIARRALAPALGEQLFVAYTASWETWRCMVLPALLAEPGAWLDDDLLAAALDDALRELGEPVPTWGELHRIVLAHPFAQIPGLETMFTAVDVGAGGDAQTVAAAAVDGAAGAGRRAAVIASARMVWDLAEPERSAWTVPTGVSGNPVSSHWSDQAGTHTDRSAAGSRDAGHVERLTLTPGVSR